jgi:hypothetical protein
MITPTRNASTRGSEKMWLIRLLSQRSVQITVTLWIIAYLVVLVVAHGSLPFVRPVLENVPFVGQLIAPTAELIEVLVLMGVVYWLTRRRAIPDMAARAPDRATALREIWLLIGYSVLGQIGGFLIARAFGWHPFSFHIAGTLYGAPEGGLPAPAEAFVWAMYNFVVYVVVPYLFFRRRYSAEALNLKSSNRRNDLLVIVVVLVLETSFQLLALSSAILRLTPSQLALGIPLTFVLYFLGTVLPAMILIYVILVPRLLKLTGSIATTVILGGIAYTLVHGLDAWLLFASPTQAVLSVIFLFFQYLPPGMFKTFLTLRTGNAWVHVWAYHALAPHTLIDTPLMVKIFGIQ